MFMLGCSINAQGQSMMSILQPSDTTYYQVCARMEAYFDLHGCDENDEDGLFAKFGRWKRFWQYRTDSQGRFNIGAVYAQTLLQDIEFCNEELDPAIQWTNLGPYNSQGADANYGTIAETQNQGRLECISVNPNDANDIVVGATNSNIYRSTDGGANWHNTTYDEGYSLTGFSAIHHHPDNPNFVYASSGSRKGPAIWGLGNNPYALGILYSDDGGDTWHATGLSYENPAANILIGGYLHGDVQGLIIDPNSTETNTILYASVQNRLMRWQGNAAAGANDGSSTYGNWTEIPLNVGPAQYVYDMGIETNGTLWFTNAIGLYRVMPGAATATLVNIFTTTGEAGLIPIPTAYAGLDLGYWDLIGTLDVNRQDHIVIRIQFVAGQDLDLPPNPSPPTPSANFSYRSTDGGNTWTQIIDIPAPNPFFAEFVLSPYNSNIIYAENSTRRVIKSVNGAAFLATNDNNNHLDVRHIYVYNAADNTGNTDALYVATDGGISKTINGNDWQDITGEGLTISQFIGIGLDELEADLVLGGCQDGSINYYRKGAWCETAPGGDNGDALVIAREISNSEKVVFQESQNNL